MISVIRFGDSEKRLTRSPDGNVNFCSTDYDYRYRLSADNWPVGEEFERQTAETTLE